MNMWQIFEKKTLQKSVKKLPKDVLKHYELWKRIVEHQGVTGLKRIPGYNDEALKGEWKGFRSSRLTKQWRVLYTAIGKELAVYVVDINPHNYKRKR